MKRSNAIVSLLLAFLTCFNLVAGITVSAESAAPETAQQEATPEPAPPAATTEAAAPAPQALVTALAPVQNLQAKSTTQGVLLTWSPVVGADGYLIYKMYPGETSMTYRYMVSSQRFLDTQAPTHDYSFYRVHPYRMNGIAMIPGQSTSYVYGKRISLSAVTNLKAIGGTQKVTLSWNPVTGAEGYAIYRQGPNDPAMTFHGVTTSGSYVDYFAYDPLKPLNNKFYRVYPYVMVDGVRVLGPSTEYVYARAFATAPVTGFKAVGAPNSVSLTWNPVIGARGYMIWRQLPGESMRYWKSTTTLNQADTSPAPNAYTFYHIQPWTSGGLVGSDGGTGEIMVPGPFTNYVYAKPTK